MSAFLKDAFMTVSQVIAKLGGPQEATELLGVSRQLLYRWEAEGIPGKRWKQIARIAKLNGVRGLTVEVLAAATPNRART